MRGGLVVTGVLAGALACGACGDGVALIDAPLADATTTRGPVSVHVATAAAGFDRVFFQNADSTLVLATRTNSNGDAMALMEPGGFVTVFDGIQLYTWSDVQIGDELVLEPPVSSSPTNFFPDVQVEVEPLEGATRYLLYTPCDVVRDVTFATTNPFAPGFSTCTQRVNLLLVAGNPTPIGSHYRENVDLAATSTLALGPYAPIRTTTVDIQTPPSVTDVFVQTTLDQVPYTDARSFISTLGGHTSVPVPIPAGPFTTRTLVTAQGSFGEGDAVAIPSTVRATAWGPFATDVSLDLSLRELTAEPTIDPTTYRVEWAEAAEGLEPNVMVLTLFVTNGTPWNVIAAPSESRVRLPVLPQESFRLPPSATLSSYALIAIDGGYDRVRTHLLGHWSSTDPRFPGLSGRAAYRTQF